MKRALMIVIATSLVMLCACVAGSGEAAHAAAGGPIAQLLLGFWHGVIAPITLIVEVVGHFFPHLLPWRAQIYETAAAGWAYDIGFYVGLAGGPLFGWTRWRR